MARTREFDPDDALAKAMLVFWAKGYFDTSVEDLVDATGVSRYGLYGEFKSKEGLFLAVLDHYQDAVLGSIFKTVELPGASLPEIRAFFAAIVKVAHQPAARLGCLMCNTASEVAPLDPGVAGKVGAFHKRFSTGFRKALKNAVARGELAPDFDTTAQADFLVGILHASSSLNRAGAGQKMVGNMVATALRTLT